MREEAAIHRRLSRRKRNRALRAVWI